jgi:hypothetical protein
VASTLLVSNAAMVLLAARCRSSLWPTSRLPSPLRCGRIRTGQHDRAVQMMVPAAIGGEYGEYMLGYF